MSEKEHVIISWLKDAMSGGGVAGQGGRVAGWRGFGLEGEGGWDGRGAGGL